MTKKSSTRKKSAKAKEPALHVAVLLPTKGRAKTAAKRARELLKTPLPAGVKLTVIPAVEYSDAETLKALARVEGLPGGSSLELVKRPAKTTAVQGFNMAYARARSLGADWVVLGADDVEWKDGWLEKALDAARGGAQVVGLNDGHTDMAHYGAHYMATVAFLEEHHGGVMAPPQYSSWWFDREIGERANAMGVYAYTPEAVIEHHHPDWGLAEMDDTYREAWPAHDVDRDLYLHRQFAGRPIDYAPATEADPADLVDATDAARALAGEAGVDISTVEGSGAEGRILKSDVDAAAETGANAGAAE
jgi:hypothetical protein